MSVRGGKPAKHGRDHKPGGEDPIPGVGLGKWATVTYGQQTHTIDGLGIIRFRWRKLYTNAPDLFTLQNISEDTIRAGTNSWANYLGIAEDGLYHVHSKAFRGITSFDTFDTYLRAVYDNGAGDADFNTMSGGGGVLFDTTSTPSNEHFATAEWTHESMTHYAVAILDSASEGVTLPWKISCRIVTTKTGSIAVGAAMHVVQVSPGTDIAATDIG